MIRLPRRARALCLGLVLSGCGARSELSPSGAPTHTGGGLVPPAPSCAKPAPVPTVLYTNADETTEPLAIDADALYFTDSSAGVTRVPKCGGPAVALALPHGVYLTPPSPLAVAAGNVAWLAQGGPPQGGGAAAISVVPAAPGGQARFLASAAQISFSIGLDADHVFYADDAIESVPLAGGTPTILASGRSGLAAVDDVNVYFYQWPPTGAALASVPKSGGDVTLLGPSLSYADSYEEHALPYGYFAQDDDAIYWVDSPGPGYEPSVMRVLKSGGPAEVFVSGEKVMGWLVVDDTHVYWSTVEPAIRRAPKTGGSAETVVTLPPVPAATGPAATVIAVDAKTLYWWQGHSLMKLDK